MRRSHTIAFVVTPIASIASAQLAPNATDDDGKRNITCDLDR